MSATLLSNYVLGISLLKNIAKRFSAVENFYNDYDESIKKLQHVERILYQMGSLDASLSMNRSPLVSMRAS